MSLSSRNLQPYEDRWKYVISISLQIDPREAVNKIVQGSTKKAGSNTKCYIFYSLLLPCNHILLKYSAKTKGDQ